MFASRWGSCAWLLTVTWLAGVGPLTGQERGREPPRPEIRGQVKAVDLAARTITLSAAEGRQPAAEKTYPLSKDVEVAVDPGFGRRGFFKEGKLADLAPGTLVALTLAPDSKTIDSIVAEGPTVRGILKAVDVEKRSLTIGLAPTRREENAEEKTYTLAPDAEIGVDDGRARRFSVKEGKLTDLATATIVTLRLSVDQKQVHALLAEGPVLAGTVKAVDVSKKTVTLALPPGRGGEGGEDKTVDLASDATILLDDGRGRRLSLREGKLTDVPVGALAQLKLTPAQKTATLLRVEGPNLPAMLKAVDAKKSTITVLTRKSREDNPEEKTLPVAKDARILIEGKTGQLADLKVGEEGTFALLRLSLNQQTVQGIAVASQRRER